MMKSCCRSLRTSEIGVGLCTACLIALGGPAAAEPIATSASEVAAVRLHLDVQRKKIQSLAVSYQMKVTFDASAQKAGLGRGVVIERTMAFAFKGTKRYCKTEESSWRLGGGKASVHRVSVFNGKTCFIVEPKVVTIQSEKSNYTENGDYLIALGWPISERDRLALQQGSDDHLFLPDSLTHPDWKSEKPINLAGTRCFVLNNPTLGDTLYFDASRGYALVRRERKFDVLSNTLNFSDFVQLQGIWFPKVIDSTVVYNKLNNSKTKGEAKKLIKVTSIHANDVPDSLFDRPPFSPGVQVNDVRQQISYVYDEGDNTLATSVQRTNDLVHLSRQTLYRPYLIASSVFLATVFSGLTILRLIRRYHLRQKHEGG